MRRRYEAPTVRDVLDASEVRKLASWFDRAMQPMIWAHVGPRMGECLHAQHDGRACAPCPACQFIRDSFRL